MPTEKPRVLVLATGGTIANPLDIEGYLSATELVDAIPELADAAEITTVDVASTGSSGITPQIWFDLHDQIAAAVAADDPPDGIVVTHGSNTVEETAYFLNLTLDTAAPVVLTAAQRNHRQLGNDGDRNLLDAVRVAAHPDAGGRGAMVVVNDEIHHARDVTKVVSTRPDAWSSANLGVLGLLDKQGGLRFYRRSERRHAPDTAFDLDGVDPSAFPRVEIVYSAAAMDGGAVHDALDRGTDGLVVAALPTGTPSTPTGWTDTQADALRGAADTIPVVFSHRGAEGYPYERPPFLNGDTLSPQKARVLLALGLFETTDRDELQRLFRTH